ncbi:hypothetical protein BLA24_04715 [Streptomyces cinnamoneus]|uniref:Small hydrophobic membrane protein n=1 Tax=Streptomyces cinnamoneus TaxID=53446 RepID=A0A2G1XNQ6_STRCJ|nr:hypothetical protein [Streptomyces cinnamoneus]PHQ52872.1 hypothetical protein BLA24_04715 [Streptomyces cinnamoneus]
MLFLAAALLVLGILSGTVAHIPLTVSVFSAMAICGWLLLFAVRERHRRNR